jgi:hypothetical protein
VGNPVAVIMAVRKADEGTIDDFLALAAEGRPTSNDLTSNHDDLYDENGLPT